MSDGGSEQIHECMFVTARGEKLNIDDGQRDRSRTQLRLVYCTPTGMEDVWQKDMFATLCPLLGRHASHRGVIKMVGEHMM